MIKKTNKVGLHFRRFVKNFNDELENHEATLFKIPPV